MKFLKISLKLVAAIILFAIIGGTLFIVTFDANQYRALISEQVKLQTGREFTLVNIKPSVFPWLGIELQQLSLGNAKGFRAENMLRIEQLNVRVKLMPLFRQQISIDTLQVQGLEVFLEKNKQGESNWADLVEPRPPVSRQNQQVPNKADADMTSSEPLTSWLVNGVDIRDAKIIWADASTGQNIQLQKINIELGAIRVGEPLSVALSARVQLPEPDMSVMLTLQTQAELNLATQKLKLDALSFNAQVVLVEGDITHVNLHLTTDLNANLKQQRFSLPAYNIQLDMQGKVFADDALRLKLQGAAEIDLQKKTAEMKPLLLDVLGLKVKSQLSLTQLLTEPKAKGRFEVQAFNPRQLAKKLKIELPKMNNERALTQAELVFAFAATPQHVNIKSLKLKLDKSTLLGDVWLQNLASPKVRYVLNLDQLELNDYLSPPTKALPVTSSAPVQGAAATAGVKADAVIELPVALLRSLNVNGEINIESLQAFEQRISKIKIKSLAQAGVIKIPLLNASVLKGRVVASAQLDVSKNTPHYQLAFKGKGLNVDNIVNPVLQDMLGEKSVSMSGAANLHANIKTRGQIVKQLIAKSQGQLNLTMGAAKLQGVDAEYFVRQAVIDYIEKKKQTVPQDWRVAYQPQETTALKRVRASGIIRNGVVENKDLLLDASRFSIRGAGKINFPQEKLNYRVVIDVQPTKTKTAAERLLDIPMPVFIKGNFAQPDISVDSKVWLKSVGKKLKAEVKKEIKQKLKIEQKQQQKKAKKKLNKKLEKLKNKYKDKFKGLFK